MSDITQFLLSHGGPVLFAIVFAEQAGLPLPSAPWLLAAGALSASSKINAALAIEMAALAALMAGSLGVAVQVIVVVEPKLALDKKPLFWSDGLG
jgi:membrane protein DedA with SNARE-associated domain